jgi:antitoxin ParD1/3/4
MQISLTADQEALIQSHAAARGLPSIEEAAQELLVEKLAELELAADDLEWAKPYIDEARADIERGDVITLEEHRARNAARLAALRE